jgi:hypothetical protein
MKGIGAECGVKTEAIVFWDDSKDFPHMRQGGFVGLGKVRRRISWRCAREENPSPA